MKNYIVMAWNQYYPEEGWNQVKFSTNDFQEAIEESKKYAGGYDFVSIVDLQCLKEVVYFTASETDRIIAFEP